MKKRALKLAKVGAMFVPDQLVEKAALYRQRNSIYKDNYKRFGGMVHAVMPTIVLKSADDCNRFGVLNMLFSKLSRYAAQFPDGGHPDSLDDMCVYAMMLKELDKDALERRKKHVKKVGKLGAK